MSEWQPIETAPSDGTHVTVVNEHNPNIAQTTVHWFDGGWHLSVNQMGEFSEYVWGTPTHWMALPPPPAVLVATNIIEQPLWQVIDLADKLREAQRTYLADRTQEHGAAVGAAAKAYDDARAALSYVDCRQVTISDEPIRVRVGRVNDHQ